MFSESVVTTIDQVGENLFLSVSICYSEEVGMKMLWPLEIADLNDCPIL